MRHQLGLRRSGVEFRRSSRPAVGCESLEGRALMSADLRSIDGAGNNLSHPSWGAAGTDLIRLTPAQYSDGIAAPSGQDRPSARAISNTISDTSDQTIINDRELSNFVYAWGQFIDHDLDLTNTASPRSAFNIQVPAGDPSFDPGATGSTVIPVSRSDFDPATGTDTAHPRQQINSITAYLDGSMVYGSDVVRARALRTLSGGRLKTSNGDLLPLNTDGFANANDTHRTPDDQLFLAGDVRANENIELTAIQTLFMREHNSQADRIARANPGWSDEQIYQQARKIVIGEIQAITYNEYLPALLGQQSIRPSRGYNPNINAGISTEFSTAAFRFGHSMLGDDVEFLDNNGNETQDAMELKDAFFNPNVLKSSGIDSLLKYLASDRAQEIDTRVVDSLRNFLFGEPGQGGLDLASLNIQRGRDHGLADYNTTRAALGLPRVTGFDQITSDAALQSRLKDLYGSVDKIDLWVGGLAEDHIPGGSLGPLFTRIIADQFMRLRDGDRFFYAWQFKGQQLKEIDQTSLSDVIKRNTSLTNVQDNAFVFRTEISGTVFGDSNANGRFEPRERGLAGRTIRLTDAMGNLLESTTTDARGVYRFQNTGLGAFQISEVVPAGAFLTTPGTKSVVITRGIVVGGQDFGESASSRSRQGQPIDSRLRDSPISCRQGPRQPTTPGCKPHFEVADRRDLVAEVPLGEPPIIRCSPTRDRNDQAFASCSAWAWILRMASAI